VPSVRWTLAPPTAVQKEFKVTKRQQIVGIGEVLWDVFPDGPRFGGAPANFSCSAKEVGGDAFDVAMVSCVGIDLHGKNAVREFERRQVDVSFLTSFDRPTGQVLVTLDSLGQASYRFLDDTAWDHLAWSDQLQALATRTDAVCFGTLGQRSEISRRTIRQFVAATPAHCLRILDVNLRSPFWDASVVLESVPIANVLKLNSDEFSLVADLLSIDGSPIGQLTALQQKFSLRLVVLTCGASGSILLNEKGVVSQLAGQPTTVVDTVGAGDAFTAAIAVGLLLQKPLEEIHAMADRVAAFVCTQPGATPPFPDAFKVPSPIR